MTNQTDRDQIEIDIDAAKSIIQEKDDVLMLSSIPAFNRIFEIGYFKTEAIRLVSLMSDPDLQGDEQIKGINGDMRAISSLQHYLRDIIKMGQAAEIALPSYEKEQEKILNEEDQEFADA